ncbi:MAG: hypothetical protein KatS3mg095_0169 [Candidatus Parcubacteria bacterium]|nr:MAG: hypothetical protein KatS3mg095_0169 [Candidatus Parcubacteria bacterium]
MVFKNIDQIKQRDQEKNKGIVFSIFGNKVKVKIFDSDKKYLLRFEVTFPENKPLKEKNLINALKIYLNEKKTNEPDKEKEIEELLKKINSEDFKKAKLGEIIDTLRQYGI